MIMMMQTDQPIELPVRPLSIRVWGDRDPNKHAHLSQNPLAFSIFC